jgi:hypothetical protein
VAQGDLLKVHPGHADEQCDPRLPDEASPHGAGPDSGHLLAG